MESKAIKEIVIVGGGSAGWMTAAALSNTLQKDVSIKLIESDEIGIVGVGEATIPPIKLFNQTLGINEFDFLKATMGTYKLGIQFVNWGKIGNSYFHPFGSFGAQFDAVSLHQHWLKAFKDNKAEKLDNYCMGWVVAEQNKFAQPSPDMRNVLSTYDYAFHFDATLYAKYLSEYSKARGVKRIEGKIVNVRTSQTNGFVESVELADGTIHCGQLFIDCSGIRALLIEGALKTGYEDWRKFLPCDSALAVPTKSTPDITPYTRSTAHESGWQWRIPLQHRIGNGHVYSSPFISHEDAKTKLLQNLDSETIAEPRLIQYVTGRRKKIFNKNVVAIGLSSGFLEPLESTSLHLIQAGIAKLLAFFPDADFDESVTDEYNRIAISEFERIRDFIVLHYKLNQRQDSEFWKYCANMEIPDTLKEKIEHFKKFGRIITREFDLFGPQSWLAVHIGQDNIPNASEPVLNYRTTDAPAYLAKLRAAMLAAAKPLPTHNSFIEQNCQSK